MQITSSTYAGGYTLQAKMLKMADVAKQCNVKLIFNSFSIENERIFYTAHGKASNIEIFKNNIC